MDFFSTYKLYKQGTSQVVEWLGKTAAQFGYKVGLPDTTSSQEEKKAKKTRSKTSDGDGSTKCQVTKYTVAELPVLARFILKHFQQTSNFKTLPGILTVLKDVIVKRKEWAKAFGLPDANTSASNKRHKHFVTVLEDVYEILGGAMTALQQQENKGQKSEVPLSDGKSTSVEETALSNLFTVLDIEESMHQEEESGDQAEPIRKPARRSFPSTRPTARTTYELEDDIIEDEIDFMIYCFFKDFQAVRNHISQSWADYKSGALDLVAVAVTTNVALEMLQRAETVLLESLPEKLTLFNYQRVAAFLLTAVAPTRGVDPKLFLHSAVLIDMDMKDVMDFTCWPVFMVLASFVILHGEHLRGDHLRVLKPGKLGKIDQTGRSLSWMEKLNQDRIVLYELLPELCILKDVRLPIPYLDELSLGLMEMIQTEIIPMWPVLGCQIYLDIHYTMLSDIGMAHKELQTMGHHFSTTLQEYLEFSKTMSFDTFPEQWMKHGMEEAKVNVDKSFREVKLEADLWINQDFLAASRKRGLKKLHLPESTVRPYNFLSRHPLLCGLLLFRLNLKLQECGILVADALGSSLFNMIHLYNAVKRESLEEDGFPLWQDLEAIICIQGKEHLFMGDYPENAAEYLKRWSLVTGVSASNFAQNRRQGRHTSLSPIAVAKRGPRLTMKASTTSDIFRDQYCENKTTSEVTFHKIEKLLISTSSSSSLGIKVGTGSKRRQRPFTSVSFLTSLQAHIQSDILALNINFFGLHFRCTSLLRDISVKLEPVLSKGLGPGDLEGEFYLRFLVPHLLGIANDSEKAARFFKLVKCSEVVRSAVLVEAGDVVKALVQNEGDRELQRVRRVCRGYASMESTTRTEYCRPASNCSEEMFQGKNEGHSQLPRHRVVIV